MAMTRLALNKRFFITWVSLVFGTAALYGLFALYNTLVASTPLYLIPTEPIYWPITAAYGAALLYPVLRSIKHLSRLVAMSIICVGWFCSLLLFYPTDGGDVLGYDTTSGVTLYITQAIGLLVLAFITDGQDRVLIIQMICFSIALAISMAMIAVIADPFLVFTSIIVKMDYYWSFYASNIILLGLFSSCVEPVFEPETKAKDSQPVAEYKEAA